MRCRQGILSLGVFGYGPLVCTEASLHGPLTSESTMKIKQSSRESREDRRRSFGIGGAGNIRMFSRVVPPLVSSQPHCRHCADWIPPNRHQGRSSRQRCATLRALGAAAAEQCPEQGVVLHLSVEQLERCQGALSDQVEQKLIGLGFCWMMENREMAFWYRSLLHPSSSRDVTEILRWHAAAAGDEV